MENKKHWFKKLFSPKKSDCCGIKVEQVPEDKRGPCCSGCGTKNDTQDARVPEK